MARRKRLTKTQHRRAQQRERSKQIAQARTQHELRQREFWHGGQGGLTAGSIISSRAEMAESFGLTLQQTGLGVTSLHRVYFSDDYEFARAWAARLLLRDDTTGMLMEQGTLYRVEPLGDIEIDPDFDHASISWCAPRARVLEVVETNVRLDIYDTTQRIGPYQTWQDDSPVYSEDGTYRLAPEQAAEPDTYQALTTIHPWTPLESINAMFMRQHPPERPNPRTHSAILHRARAALDVYGLHRQRVRDLQRAGIELLEVLTPDGREGVAAQDQEGKHLGVVTFSRPAPDVALIEQVVVEPRWRGHGLGAALLVEAQWGETPWLTIGHCDPEVGVFFSRLGYTVLHPGVALPNPTGIELPEATLPAGECWFFREGRL